MSLKSSLLTATVVCGSAGIAASANASSYLISTYFGNQVRLHNNSGSFVQNLTGTSLSGPQAIAYGPDGKLYVADENHSSVHRYNPATMSYVDTFVTSGLGGLNGPTGLTFDNAGNLLVASFNTNSVLKYKVGTGQFLGTLVTTGLGGLSGPDVGMKVGPDGKLYVPSFWNHRILRYDATTGALIDTFITSGSGGLIEPRVMLWKGEHMYVSSDGGDKVLRYNKNTGAFVDTFVAPGAGGLNGAVGMIFDDNGNLLVTSAWNNRVLRFNGTTGAYMNDYIGAGGGLNGPTFIAAVPEPATLGAFAIGAAFLAGRRKTLLTKRRTQ